MKLTVAFSVLFFAAQAALADWTQWRGAPDGQGLVRGPAPVTAWSPEKHILWKAAVNGEGSGSPVVYAGKVYLAAADARTEKMYLHCFDRKTGKQLWERIVFWGGLLGNLHKNNTHASATPATNGEVITVVFGMKRALWLAALDMDGKKMWEVEVARVKSQFGSGTSPVIYRDRVIVMNDMEPNQVIAAYSLADGDLLWRTKRNLADTPGLHSYSTPRVFPVMGKDRIVTTGMEKVIFYDPETGAADWEIDAGANVTVGTPLVHRRFLYVNGGWPQNGMSAIDLKRREVIWKNRFNTYIASMVFYRDYLYGVTNRGELACIDARSGTVVWRERFREDTQSSPFIAGGHLYLTFRNGITKVIKPDPSRYIEVAENRLPGMADATPAVVDGLIFHRSGDTLYCIGETEKN